MSVPILYPRYYVAADGCGVESAAPLCLEIDRLILFKLKLV